MKTISLIKKQALIIMLIVLAVCLLLASWASVLAAEDSLPVSEPDYKALMDFTENTIQTETKNLKILQAQLKQLQKMKLAINTEINAYKVQYSTHGNLLLLPKTEVKHLEIARTDNRIASENVKASINDFKEKAEAARINQEQTENQITLNKEQRESLKAVKENNKDLSNTIKKLYNLLKLLSAKSDVLKSIQTIHLDHIKSFEDILSKQEGLSGDFDQQINLRKRQSLFSRTPSPFVLLDINNILQELNKFNESLRQLLTKKRWLKELRTDWKSGRALLLSLFLIFCLFQITLMRLRRYLAEYSYHGTVENTNFRHITVEIIKSSFHFLGLTVFIYFYAGFSGLYSTISFVRLIVFIFSIALFTQWAHSFLTSWLHSYPWLSKDSAKLLHRLISFIRYYSVLYLLIDWILVESSPLLFLVRIIMEIFLLIWAFVFLNKYKAAHQETDGLSSSKRILILSLAFYGIVGTGILMELLAYGRLSAYWYASCGISIIVIAWSILLFLVLQEWHHTSKKKIKHDDDSSQKPVYLLRWLLIQFSWLLWLLATILLLVMTWAGKETVLSNFFTILTHTFAIGSINISLINLISAFFILALTQALSRFSRYFLKEKILTGSGIDKGLQDSITTIIVYSFWCFGIILSLHVFGFGTTSLAVGFGALGIGLGFGLQNIFNNFISGIIMLIERPIKVGDDLEINDAWATVKKINVRSTVVQTYDNASIIIPNSEFISQQVKNWSFQDKRIRIQIDVGVAYGSDIELVRKTLYEIAEKTPKIFKNPTPDVLFMDFADSALIFRLRVWTYIDNMLRTATTVRFEIDRLFKERNINIPFPQRDVNLFTQNEIHDSEPDKGGYNDIHTF